MTTALMIIANNGFQDTEYGVPRAMLEEAGIHVTVAAGSKGLCIGKFGHEAEAEHSLSEVSGSEYDAVIFIGGPGAAQEYQNDQDYVRLAKEANILAAICITPSILAKTGIFAGKNVTGWDHEGIEQAEIERHGGIFTGEDVSIDGNIITANGPEAAQDFSTVIIKKLKP